MSKIVGKELTQEELTAVLAGRMKDRGRFIVCEENLSKIDYELEAYVRLLSLIGSGKLKVRNRPRYNGRITASMLLDNRVGIGAVA